MPQDFGSQRREMVNRQLSRRGIHNPAVLAAMAEVPRENFVGEQYREWAYRDSPLPIEEGQTISQPYVVALMIEALELKPGHRVLEVGAGSGYAAAVLSRISERVFAIEYHEKLVELARERAVNLGYDNIELLCGDGTRGWPAYAPYDAILVSAGGPDVPPSLLQQLKIGGCIVIPVGDHTHSQELLRIRRVREHEYDQESLGRVQFVPLVGSEGWRGGDTDATAAPPRPTFDLSIQRRHLAGKIARVCEPFEDIETSDLESLLERISRARVVLLGEATHGTSEFYRMRARITRELILHGGFNIVAIEADWPDVAVIDRYVRQWNGHVGPGEAFSRFPQWMWRNRETLDFINWLAEHNGRLGRTEEKAGIHGLDIYSLYSSIANVLDYLERVDPAAAARARTRYACFSPWEKEPAVYGQATVAGERKDCEEEVVATLRELLEKRVAYSRADGEALFDAERNARLIQSAEQYYRVMYHGSRESWNLRDRHMFETLQAVVCHRGEDSRAVVWAHNSHVGNAAHTEMGMRGELNIGQLAREAWGDDVHLIGFGTDHGTVVAASEWDGDARITQVTPSLPDSYERVMHECPHTRFILPLRAGAIPASLHHDLASPRLQRAIGVIYRPETERISHYFKSVLSKQFDEFIWFDESAAVDALSPDVIAGLPSTHPFAASGHHA